MRIRYKDEAIGEPICQAKTKRKQNSIVYDADRLYMGDISDQKINLHKICMC